jgi:hypothetical protein
MLLNSDVMYSNVYTKQRVVMCSNVYKEL